MRSTKFIILGTIIITFIYLIIINSIFNGNYINGLLQNDSPKIDSSIIKVGVGDSAKVDIVRNRWYGKIYESLSSNSKNSRLYLFNAIPLPLQKANANYKTTHIIFFSIIFLTIFTTISIDLFSRKPKIQKKEESKKEEITKIQEEVKTKDIVYEIKY